MFLQSKLLLFVLVVSRLVDFAVLAGNTIISRVRGLGTARCRNDLLILSTQRLITLLMFMS